MVEAHIGFDFQCDQGKKRKFSQWKRNNDKTIIIMWTFFVSTFYEQMVFVCIYLIVYLDA